MRECLKHLGKPLLACLTFCVAQVLCGIIPAVYLQLHHGQFDAVSYALLGVGVMLSGVITVLVCRYGLKMLSFSESIRPSGIAVSIAACGLLGAICCSLASNLVEEQLNLPDMLGDKMEGLCHSVIGVLCIALIGPVCEELVFRQAILGHLLKRGVGQWPAILISALIFGVIHFNPAQVVFAAILGVVLGMLYCKTRNILVSGLVHILNNSFAVVLGLTMGGDFKLSSMFHSTMSLWISIAGCIFLCILLMVKFWKGR